MPWQNEKNKLSKFEVLKKILWNIWKGEFSSMAMTTSDFSQKYLLYQAVKKWIYPIHLYIS